MATPQVERIAYVTDFGAGIYIGQMRARLGALLPGVPVIDLVHDLPPFRPDLAAYLLPALVRDMPDGTLYLCVVDPGVGGERAVLVIELDGNWLVGPDNGLFAPLVSRAREVSVGRVGWRPPRMSASFHGRDWFVPAAARVCRGENLQLTPLDPSAMVGADWPAELRSGSVCRPVRQSDDRAGSASRRSSILPGSGSASTPIRADLLRGRAGRGILVRKRPRSGRDRRQSGRADLILGLSAGDHIGPCWRLSARERQASLAAASRAELNTRFPVSGANANFRGSTNAPPLAAHAKRFPARCWGIGASAFRAQ